MTKSDYIEGEEFGKKVFKDRKETCRSSPDLCALMLSQTVCDTLTNKIEKNGCESAVRTEFKKKK